MKVQVIRARFVPGRVLIGPKALGDGYYRIVSQHDRSGRIEAYDPPSRSWAPAPEHIAFNDVWSAPTATQWAMDLAGVLPATIEDGDLADEESLSLTREAEPPAGLEMSLQG